MNCPKCKSEESLRFMQDSIASYHISESEKTFEMNHPLDESWVECMVCSETSKNQDELRVILTRLK